MGDILVYNAANENSLTVYRGGAIVKTIRTTPISIAVLLKTKMIEEAVAVPPKPVSPAPQKPAAAPKPVAKSKVELKKKDVEKIKESLVAHKKGETLSTEEVLASIAPACPFGYTKEEPGTEHVCALHPSPPKSRSEAKRVAIMKGEDPAAAAAAVPSKTSAERLADRVKSVKLDPADIGVPMLMEEKPAPPAEEK